MFDRYIEIDRNRLSSLGTYHVTKVIGVGGGVRFFGSKPDITLISYH